MSILSFDSLAAIAPRIKDEPQAVARRRAPPGEPPLRRPRALPVEIAFLKDYGAPVEALQEAAALARRQGVAADAALLAEGVVSEAHFYRALADYLGVAFLDEDFDVEPAPGADPAYLQLSEPRLGAKWLFAPTGAGVAQLMNVARTPHGRPLFAVTTRTRFVDAARRAVAAEVARAAAGFAEQADPYLCVRGRLNRNLIGGTIVAFVLLVTLLFAPWRAAILVAALPLAAAFLASVFLRLFASAASYESHDETAWIDDARLPIYTVVIALYKEAVVVPQLVRALDRLDFPRAKLDIKFMLECDDHETAAALHARPPRAPYEIIVAPEGQPRTKPRALNVAMPFARGSLVCVFDAEDMPAPVQLRHAAALFARLPQDIACLQASLVIDNGAQNWMTALFAIEYAALFDVFNKGLAAMGMPIFLGGTSNHFRIEALRMVGFWDAWNVTEDADLGLRLARAGFHVRTFASQTFEEAPARFVSLVKQRTRWLKGWMQTALVHCRDPLRLYADLGLNRAIAVIAMFTGGFLGPLLGPLLTIRLIYQAIFGALLAPESSLDVAFSTLWCFTAISGAFALLTPMLIGMWRRKLTRFWPALLLLPLWLAMLTIAAWRALIELWTRPFHWEKTEHGLTARGVSLPPSPFWGGADREAT